MIAWGIVIFVLIVIALLRFGVRVEYSADGVIVQLIAGPLSPKVYPVEKDSERDEKRAKKKAAKKAKMEAKEKDKPPKDKPGMSLNDFMDMLPFAFNMLGRLRRRLLISRLTLHFKVAGDDASKIAMTYGAANAAMGELIPILENSFRIKRRDIRFETDFISDGQTIYANVAFSLAVWESMYIVAALFPILKILLRRKPAKKDAYGSVPKSNAGKEV